MALWLKSAPTNDSTQVERGREGLGGKRQRVVRLIRNTCGSEDAAGEIDVRQRAFEHDRRAIQRHRRHVGELAATGGPETAGYRRQLFLAVARDKGAGSSFSVGRRQDDGSLAFRRNGRGCPRELLDAGQQIVQPLLEAGIELCRPWPRPR